MMTSAPSALGIAGYGAFVPSARMKRSVIATAHQWMAPALRALGKGERAFCSWDEDSITMAVEALRDSLSTAPRTPAQLVTLASTTLPFADLQNSAIVANALGLPEGIRTLDVGNSERAGIAGMLNTLASNADEALFVVSDRPRAKPASTQELASGAGAAAFRISRRNVVAELVGSSSRTDFFVDHFRAAGQAYPYFWEERWVRDEGFTKLVPSAVLAGLSSAALRPADVRHFILPSPIQGMAANLAKRIGIDPAAVVDPLDEHCGFTGCAHGPLMLVNALENAAPGEIIVLVGFGQGCDVAIFRTTEALKDFRPRHGLQGALANATIHEDYLRMLSSDGGIELDWGMRSERVVKTILTEQYRSNSQLATLNAGKCPKCRTIQFPQLPYCVNPTCHIRMDGCEQISLVDEPAKALTHTADWLAYHPSPPLQVGLVQFDNGARLLMEFVDVVSGDISAGSRVRMVFRRKDIDKTFGYARYFWKAAPVKV